MSEKEKGLLTLGSKAYEDCNSSYEVRMKDYDYGYYHNILLRYSPKQSTWTKPGKKAYSLKSNGDGFLFINHWDKTEIELNYSEASALRALLKLSDSDGATFQYSKYKNEKEG